MVYNYRREDVEHVVVEPHPGATVAHNGVIETHSTAGGAQKE
jgi:hypothetical protein